MTSCIFMRNYAELENSWLYTLYRFIFHLIQILDTSNFFMQLSFKIKNIYMTKFSLHETLFHKIFTIPLLFKISNLCGKWF